MGDSPIDFPRLYGAPLSAPDKVQELLRDPIKHWKPERSAYEAAHSWIGSGRRPGGGLPPKVRDRLAEAPEWSHAKVVAGFFEHGTALDTQRGPSSNDLLVICDLGDELGVMAVEAKAGESFGQIVDDWNTTPGRTARFQWACTEFGVDPASCGALRWQLFHRTLSAVIEAKRFHARHAMMLVHDFCPAETWVDDYASFASAIGASDARVNAMSSPIPVRGVSLRLAWVRDTPTAQAAASRSTT